MVSLLPDLFFTTKTQSLADEMAAGVVRLVDQRRVLLPSKTAKVSICSSLENAMEFLREASLLATIQLFLGKLCYHTPT